MISPIEKLNKLALLWGEAQKKIAYSYLREAFNKKNHILIDIHQ